MNTEQLAQDCYLTPRIEPATSHLCESNDLAITPPGHTELQSAFTKSFSVNSSFSQLVSGSTVNHLCLISLDHQRVHRESSNTIQ